MKGGGEQGLDYHIPILKNDFFENHFESIKRGFNNDIFYWDQV